jgi:hypothetical protein
MKKKISTTEHAETTEFFIKTKNKNHFVGIGFSLPFDPQGLKSGGWTERRRRAQSP